ncbi:hypothetical protein JCM5350_001818 [Sporobolomyces pararoseus]
MPQPYPSHIDLSPLNLLRYDAEMGMWAVYTNEGESLQEIDRSPLHILNCAYELYQAEHPQVTIPPQFTTHWCNWCRFSGDRAKVRAHWKTAHEPAAGRDVCVYCYIGFSSTSTYTHFNRYCPVTGSDPELHVRQWNQRELRYDYSEQTKILYDFLCPKETANGPFVRAQVEQARKARFRAQHIEQLLGTLERCRTELKGWIERRGADIVPAGSRETLRQTLTRSIWTAKESLDHYNVRYPRDHDDPPKPDASLSKSQALLTTRKRLLYGF